MDAAEQRLGDEADRRRTEVTAVEIRDGLVVRGRSARIASCSQSIARARCSRARPAAAGCTSRCQHHVVGMPKTDGDGSACSRPSRVHERRARGSGRHQARAEAELFAESNRGGLGREHRVGAGVDGEAVDVIGAHEPAGAVRRFEQDEGDAARRELVRR